MALQPKFSLCSFRYFEVSVLKIILLDHMEVVGDGCQLLLLTSSIGIECWVMRFAVLFSLNAMFKLFIPFFLVDFK